MCVMYENANTCMYSFMDCIRYNLPQIMKWCCHKNWRTTNSCRNIIVRRILQDRLQLALYLRISKFFVVQNGDRKTGIQQWVLDIKKWNLAQILQKHYSLKNMNARILKESKTNKKMTKKCHLTGLDTMVTIPHTNRTKLIQANRDSAWPYWFSFLKVEVGKQLQHMFMTT